jgi:hypothetical protein
MKDVDYKLLEPIKATGANGQEREIKTFILSAPSRQTKKYIFKFRQLITSAQAQLEVLFAKYNANAPADEKEKEKLKEKMEEVAPTEEEKLMALATSIINYSEESALDIDRLYELFEKILLCKNVCKMDNGMELDENFLSKVSLSDYQPLLTTYIANFIFPSPNQKSS